MARRETPPFERGKTYYGGASIDTNDLGGVSLEGQEFEFEDLDYSVSPGAKPARTNRLVRCRVVRNVSGINLLPRRLARFQKSGLYYGARVDGYTTTVGERGFPIDEWLPTTGVPTNDLFYIVVRGPATVVTALAGADIATDIAVGDPVLAVTAATSQSTTAGRVISLPGATSGATLENEVINRVGYAMSARATTQTNTDLVVEVGAVL